MEWEILTCVNGWGYLKGVGDSDTCQELEAFEWVFFQINN